MLILFLCLDNHKDLGNRFGVGGYPTLKWFNKGVIDNPDEYDKGRDLESLISFVEEKTGNLFDICFVVYTKKNIFLRNI
jgi:protein disulfide-isomerase A6